MAACSSIALGFGFTSAGRALLPWLRLRPVQGALLVCLGVAAIFVPMIRGNRLTGRGLLLGGGFYVAYLGLIGAFLAGWF